ncbi:MAG: hypothetical protein O2807_03360 [bacterium]|nr:hypothetical protein [bacterium]
MYSTGNVIVTTIHVLSAILAVGGVAFVRFVVLPYAAGLPEADRGAFMQGIRKRFVPILHGSFLLLILTGIHHITRLIRGGLAISPELIVKIALALIIIFIGLALTLSKGFEGMKKNPKMWLTVNLTLALIVVFLGIRVTH